MKIGALKKEKPYESKADDSLKIQTFGEGNRFPQEVLWITQGSGTGSSCIDVYSNFIAGQGFRDKAFFGLTINRKNETSDSLLFNVATDYATFNGFCLHVNYNANFKVCEINWVPFENARIGAVTASGSFDKVALHWDWAKQFTKLKKWSKDDIHILDVFNPDPVVIQSQVAVAGGWDNYKGQVYYFAGGRAGKYPLPKYFATLTDMSTEQGISNLSYRNARNNFFPGGMLIDIINTNESTDQEKENEADIIAFQGDEEACKIMYTSVKSKDEIPTFIPFESKNLDKEFTVTDEATRSRIGRAFNQPPILRAEDVGSNFGADSLLNAYNYYNSVTCKNRIAIERVFTEIFKHWGAFEYSDFSIEPLSYAKGDSLLAKIGEKGVELVMKILEMQLPVENKKALLMLSVEITSEEVDSILITGLT